MQKLFFLSSLLLLCTLFSCRKESPISSTSSNTENGISAPQSNLVWIDPSSPMTLRVASALQFSTPQTPFFNTQFVFPFPTTTIGLTPRTNSYTLNVAQSDFKYNSASSLSKFLAVRLHSTIGTSIVVLMSTLSGDLAFSTDPQFLSFDVVSEASLRQIKNNSLEPFQVELSALDAITKNILVIQNGNTLNNTNTIQHEIRSGAFATLLIVATNGDESQVIKLRINVQ